jgi:ABC-type amino acid transport substrate-binding protein
MFALVIFSGSAIFAAESALTEISIGGCGFVRPFEWVGDDGKLQGYDIAVAEEIAKRIGVKLNWETTEFPALFLGLDANRYQVIAGEISYTEERGEKYLYPKEYYVRNAESIILPKGRNQNIKNIEDLAGKRVPAIADGSTILVYLENFNKTHPDAPINLIYTDDSIAGHFAGLTSGLYDALVASGISAQEATKATGQEFDIIPLPLEVSEAISPSKFYYVFTKDGKELADKFDEALREIIADGTLKALSLEYFGVDISR